MDSVRRPAEGPARPPESPTRPPEVPIRWLDTLWLQISGTICNLRCTHCFISCAPDNHSHAMMTLEDVRRHVADAVRLGVREYYFTGGEPFMHRDLLTMIEETLRAGPVTVLTNGLFLAEETCAALARLADAAAYSLDIRVSLDGWGAEDHDAIRGPGTFRRAVEGIQRLHAGGVNPVITVTEAAEGVAAGEGRRRFLDLLRDWGLERPRFKILPLWRIGAEAKRTAGYGPDDRLSEESVTPEGLENLQCAGGRMATSRGVYVCPLLIEEPEARMGDRLDETLRPFPLGFGACVTCYVSGVTCRT
ncbi:MAG TPA: radical SAM protein [Candidatus Polarisedimenticolia bacterium]|nr:radical SAM protein [Candidatus Polarisedimenticolia bacterium]